ncbi:hypothetical protein Sjap_007327 [Stephania japonica]|uniref:Uncharacterized protein n=1 Tax=Stephania japonica TaxID=461633 RepID=A0AAP0P9X6_9MAGN
MEETSEEAHQALLSIVEQQLGNYPSNVIQTVANEVLLALQCYQNTENPIDKKAEIDKLMMNQIPDHLFDEMLLIAQRITHCSYNRETPTGFYQPTTEETRVAYKLLLNVVEDRLRDKPQIVHCVVAHEVLLILNNDSIKDQSSTRRDTIDSLLNGVSDETFDLLVFIGTLIRDFKGRWDNDVQITIPSSELEGISTIGGSNLVDSQSKKTKGFGWIKNKWSHVINGFKNQQCW